MSSVYSLAAKKLLENAEFFATKQKKAAEKITAIRKQKNLESTRKYSRSEKGKETHRRWDHSEAGKESRKKSCQKYSKAHPEVKRRISMDFYYRHREEILKKKSDWLKTPEGKAKKSEQNARAYQRRKLRKVQDGS